VETASLLMRLQPYPKAVSEDEDVVGASAYPYANEVLVEVTCRDVDDHLVVYSYAFDPGDDGLVSPVEAVPERHREVVSDALAEKGHEPSTDLADPG
jgi:hypothetical protein